jgi:autotransporter translocation and assembly factor TamB
MTVRRGGATWSATGVRYRDLNGTLVIGADRKVAIDLQTASVDPRSRIGVSRTGSARITGDLDLTHLADPGFDLEMQAVRLLAARRRDADITASGDVTIKGQYTRPRISGALNIDGDTLYLDELYRQYLIVGLDDLFGAVDTSLVSVRQVLPPSQSPFLANLLVENTSVTVGPGSWLRGSDINVEVTGNLQVDFDRRAAEDLRISGALNVVRGTYRMNYPPFARIFDVRDGTVSFPGTPGFDPNMSINAVYRARTQDNLLEIIAQVTGTLQSPRVRLTSDAQPPISESDLASYLFFGAPTYAFNNIGSRTTTGSSNGSGDAVERLGSQLGTAIGVGYFATGLQTLAQNFGLVDYVGLTAAETAPGSGAGVGGLLAGTQIELGRYISPRLFVAYTQRLASPAANAGARLEWRLSPTFTAEFSIEDRFARAASLSLIQSGESRKVYSLFLFREWGY